MNCQNCGTKLDSGARYCSHCGASVVPSLEDAAARLQKGEEAAFDTIYAGTYSIVRAVVRSFFPDNVEDQEDCIQAIYIKIYRNISKFDPSLASVQTWVKQIAKNECITEWKKKKSHQNLSIDALNMENEEPVEFEDETITFNPEAQMDQKETSRLIQELLADLPEVQKQCLLLYYAAQYKQGEIAQMLEIPEGTVKSRLYHGKKVVEERVLALEKKGVKLYSMSPIVFFAWLLSSEAEAAPDLFHVIRNSAKEMDKQGKTENMDNRSGNGGASDAGSHPTGDPGGAVANQAAASAVKTGAAKAIGMKAAAVIVGAAVLGGAGYGAVKYWNHQEEESRQESTQEKKEEAPKTENQGPEEEALTLDQIDQDRLCNYLSYVDLFSPGDDPTLGGDLYGYAYTLAYTAQTEGTTDSLIPEDQVVSVDPDAWSVTLKRSAFDGLNQVLQVTDDEMMSILDTMTQGGIVAFTEDTIVCYTNEMVLDSQAEITESVEQDGKLLVTYQWSREEGLGMPAEQETRMAVLAKADNAAGYVIESISDAALATVPEAYRTVISAYGDYYYSNGQTMDTTNLSPEDYEGFEDPYTGMGFGFDTTEITDIYYALYDVNHDGIEECFFTTDIEGWRNDYGQYYAIWTSDGTEAHQLIAGRYRIAHSICADGMIREYLSGGAESGEYLYYEFDPNGEKTVADSYEFYTYDEQVQADIAAYNEKYPLAEISLTWNKIQP